MIGRPLPSFFFLSFESFGAPEPDALERREWTGGAVVRLSASILDLTMQPDFGKANA